MNFHRTILYFVWLFLVHPALAYGCGKPISVDDVSKLSGTITLGDLNARFGEWCPGHGPYTWYKGSEGNDIWFWFKIPDEPEVVDEKGMGIKILLAIEVNEKDSKSEPKIIWPKELVGGDIKAILRKEEEKLNRLGKPPYSH